MERCDVAVVGAGLLGCFAARALSRYALKTIVLEQREDVCCGISRANTGIVYTGCDTKPGTLKTRLSVRANTGFDALCAQLDVPFSRCGSLMLSFGPRAEGVLRKKYAQGLENGVPGMALLGRDEVLAREPALSTAVTGGLYVPGTGTVNPWELGIAAFENARQNGAEFRFRERLLHLERRADGFLLETERERYLCRAVINCAGLSADGVRELCEKPLIRLFPTAADYLVLDDTAEGLLHHIIFHEPEEKGKGLTLVPTVDGNLLIGPTERPAEDSADMSADTAALEELRALCRRVLPAIPLEDTIRSFASRRPNPWGVYEENGCWQREERSISSFTLLEEAGLFSLLGIKTPGLTCAAELGEYVTGKVCAFLGDVQPNPAFDPVRRGIRRAHTLSWEERALLIEKDPAWGEVLCSCRDVTRAEVLEAIRRGAVTTDGVKRRTGAGMGRCQGARCSAAVLELLAGQLGRNEAEIMQDGPESPIVYGRRDGTL